MVEQLRSAPERMLQAPEYAIRYLLPHRELTPTFGDDAFGKLAERIDSLTAQLHATICKTPS